MLSRGCECCLSVSVKGVLCVSATPRRNMGRQKGKKTGKSDSSTNNEKDREQPAIEETPEDQELQIPSQEHCTWLLNIIRLHAKEISTEQLKEFANNQVYNLTQQIENLKKDLHALKSTAEEVEYLKSENVKKQRRIERLEYENSKRQSEIHNLKIQLDECQQKDLDQCIQIVGLPEARNDTDDVKQLVKLTKDKLGVKIKPSEFKMHRLGKKKSDKTRNAIVSFKEKKTRENIYNQRKRLIKSGNQTGSIYLNDTLTLHRQHLLFAARKMVKARKLFAAWSQQGNILVKKDEGSKIIQVKDNFDVTGLKLDEAHQNYEDKKSSGMPSTRDTSVVSHLSDYEYYCDSD